ncbi:MAG: phosphorylating glyceraldehyde-3-phosphate dehydrogenase [Candidatus Aramenus sp.]|jgi:glyceraldehyde-3-phosphate dehydrogenase (NAD(P))|nr:phosphorylating glyceraldehyde-3-phosphate dehydrogenase [Candidatus Aramenus sp.]
MIRVAVNGYGTIGKRVAEAVMLQPDMQLIGVGKTSPNAEAIIAQRKGIRIFAPEDSLKKFEESGIRVEGTIQDMVKLADVVVDATPNGVGAEYKPLYESQGKRAIFQGGEKPNVAEVSFSSLCNYDEGIGRKYIRVVSCNTTALLRTICTLSKVGKVEKVRATIIRRAADPKEIKRGPINSLVLDPASVPSHHAKDVNTVLKDLNIITTAVIAPTTLMHVHSLNVTFKEKVSKEDVINVLLNTPRIVMVSPKSKVSSTAEVIEVARDLGRARNDIKEVVVFEDSVYVNGNELILTYAVHQESIVVPENVDAIRAIHGIPAGESISTTNKTLGIIGGYLI